MTAATTTRDTEKRGSGPILSRMCVPLAAAVSVLGGVMVALNLSGYAGMAGATGFTSGAVIVGRAEDDCDNSSGAAGAKSVEVARGVFKFANSSSTDALTVADVGRPCYAADNQTLARTAGSGGTRPYAGVVVGVETDGVLVEIGAPLPGSNLQDMLIAAGEDLSSSQFYIVKVSSGAAVKAAAGQLALGVVQNAPANGAIAIVRVFGRSRVIAGATLASTGVAIASDASGKAKAASAAVVNTSDGGAASDPVIGSHALGILLLAAADDGDETEVFINHMGAVPTTAA